MKHEINVAQPEYIIEDWPGKYEAFNWLEYVVTLPNPIFLVTTRKENGAPNANLHSWGLLIGGHDYLISLLALMNSTHTAANILREREWCLNIPSRAYAAQCFNTIQLDEAADEIAAAGFTLEAAQKVRAPRIAECHTHLECALEWTRPVTEGSQWSLFAGRVLHAALDEAVMVPEPAQRLRNLGLMYNVRSTVNPLNGEFYGPNVLGLLDEIQKI